MAILKDGIYEVEDLFYKNAGYTLAVVGGEPDFAEGTGPVARFKLEVLYPGLDFSKPTKVPATVSGERCEFDKSLVKTILSVGTENEMAKRIGGMLKVLVGCSLFESAFVAGHLSDGGLVFMFQDKGAPAGRSPGGVKLDRIIPALCRVILSDPAYPDFRKSISAKTEHGDPEDIRLHRRLMKAPHNLKPAWEWTEKDAEECLEILKANPYLRECLAGNAV